MAAVATMLVGVGNAVVALVAASVSGLEMPPATAFLLGAAGVATVWLGWRMWAGARWALYVAVIGFSLLLVAQVVVADPDTPEQGTSVVVLSILVAVLVAATAHVRRVDTRGAAS